MSPVLSSKFVLKTQDTNFILFSSTKNSTFPRFLVEHGFDFQSQYSRGVPYLRGNDREEKEEANNKGVRKLFSVLVASGKPMVLHNGLIDLVFLYHNFWCALPDKLGTFVADLAEMFPGGVYDTKYIADFVSRTQVSSLETLCF